MPSPPHPNPLPRGEREPKVPAAKSVIANSTVLALAPEPSTMAIAGLGALGMIGYGLRRRKALGA